MLEQIGGPATCEYCGHWGDGSDIHICGEREKEIKASAENSPFVRAIKAAHKTGVAAERARIRRAVEGLTATWAWHGKNVSLADVLSVITEVEGKKCQG